MEPEECSENWMINLFSLQKCSPLIYECGMAANTAIDNGISTLLYAFDKYDMHTENIFRWLKLSLHIRIHIYRVLPWNVWHITLLKVNGYYVNVCSLAKELCFTAFERT
jgi:hypothetical protein